MALTNMDEENILLGMFAERMSHAKVVTKVNRVAFDDITDELELKSDPSEIYHDGSDSSIYEGNSELHRKYCGDTVSYSGQQGRGSGVLDPGKFFGSWRGTERSAVEE